ncbi:dihydroorotase, multifunctional complex type [Chloroherpeton thalassium ATCC 35110]|uniref:Dihydroorotase n=1 Tax=Chloroherpeton thalassium (strain ATCC 35110 / GB-78) TaxID=517418 RepID=B3QZ71_CHLT3|nr:dihydroorotase [Chloroherpeton thalassium]ACF13764.1 dihydroorotase, multifunctional complex type [Chloroherpeton thalassium ATCC 35110]
MSSTILKNALLINPAEKLNAVGSMKLSESGVIEAVALAPDELSAQPDDRVIDFTGRIICSGLFDMHVHFREPGYEYKETLETGSRAAVAGGFTGVAVMPNTNPPIDSAPVASYIFRKSEKLPIDIHVIGCITEGRKGEKIANYGELSGVGVCTLSDDGSAVMDVNVMRLAIEYATGFDMLLIQHCEDDHLSKKGVMNEGYFSSMLGLAGIPAISESTLLERDISLLKYLMESKGSAFRHTPRYHVAHVSTKTSLELVKRAKASGLPVTCEVTPHHFTLTEKDVFEANYDGNFIMKPPLCTESDKAAILEALVDGTIDAIATDHAPHASHEKSGGMAQASFGIIGLETAVGLTFTELVHKGIISTYRAIELLSSNPRRILKQAPVRFQPGETANLTFIDPSYNWTLQPENICSKSTNTPFMNRAFKGKSIGICSRGTVTINLA